MLLSYNETIPREIRAEMVRQDLSQWEVANRIGWRQQKLQRRLAGSVDMTISDLELITEAVGIKLNMQLTASPIHPKVSSGSGVR
jgi:predicted transcriptional regulator